MFERKYVITFNNYRIQTNSTPLIAVQCPVQEKQFIVYISIRSSKSCNVAIKI